MGEEGRALCGLCTKGYGPAGLRNPLFAEGNPELPPLPLPIPKPVADAGEIIGGGEEAVSGDSSAFLRLVRPDGAGLLRSSSSLWCLLVDEDAAELVVVIRGGGGGGWFRGSMTISIE